MSPANHTRSKFKEEKAATNLTKVVEWVDARLVASAAMMTRSAPASQLIWRSTCTTRHEYPFWARASRIRYGHIQTKLTFICGFSLNPPPPPPIPRHSSICKSVTTGRSRDVTEVATVTATWLHNVTRSRLSWYLMHKWETWTWFLFLAKDVIKYFLDVKSVPYCYYYLRVLYFANFCDLEKIAKLSTRKNFYQHIRHSGVYTIATARGFPLWNMHNHSLLIVFAFSFLSSRAITSLRKWRLMTSMIVGVLPAFVVTGER